MDKKENINEIKREMFLRYQRVEYVGFLEDAEAYLVIGNLSEDEARETIHDYERFDCGLSEDELYSLPLHEKRVTTTEEDGETIYRWMDSNKKGERAWVGYL